MTDDLPLFSQQPAGNASRYTVTEITRLIKQLLEDGIPSVTVEGEISNYVHHSSGHRYFSLKDDKSQIRCVLFKWQAGGLSCTPENGMRVLAAGNVTVYERGGQYQLTVQRLMPLGRGELLARLEELKKRLADEGVFDRTRPLPPYPRTVAVVTSPTGAAVRDIISVLRRRAPHVRIVLRPTLVQGEGAAVDIVRGIEQVNAHTDADLVIVGRGGGSIEDLWSFNEEAVARAVAGSNIPVMSAVGHETDVTLADFAADLRAPTPSAAAELAVPDSAALLERLRATRTALTGGLTAKVQELEHRVDGIRRGFSPGRILQTLMMRAQTVDEFAVRLRGSCGTEIAAREKRLERLTGALMALDPGGVLERGYAVVRRADGGSVVTDPAMVVPGDRVDVTVARGGFSADVAE
jgi:exodeoxyribonuclease VII large subunit